MDHRSTRRHAVTATLLIVAVIVHGSLWPYDFRARPGALGPLETFLGTWADPPSGRGDLIANILLYIPLGALGVFAAGSGTVWRLILVTAAGALLSASMELSQFYDEGRVTAMSDFYLNTAGTALGAGAALLLGSGSRLPLLRRLTGNPLPSLLLAAFLGYRLFPYVPVIDMHKYWRALQPLLAAPLPPAGEVYRYVAMWLTASVLLAGVFGVRASVLLAPLLVGFVLAGKVVIVNAVVSAAEVAGAAFAMVAWLLLALLPRGRITIVALVLLVEVVLARLQPFDFQPVAHEFGWLPFRAFLGGSMLVNAASLLEKVFLYGSLLWLLWCAGLRTWMATAVVALLLFGTSLVETFLPGRSAEITDTVMVLLMAGLTTLSGAHRPRFAIVDRDWPPH